MQRGPLLEGLPRWYLDAQLEKFHTGTRGHNPDNVSEYLMGNAVRGRFTTAQRRALAQYIERLPREISPHRTVKGNIERGQLLSIRCAPCHGPNGEGNPLLSAPPLTLLEDWYHLEQLRKFKAGKRGVHPEDIHGQSMRASVSDLSDQDLRDLVVFFSTQ